MKDTQTPETDAQAFDWSKDCSPAEEEIVLASFARKLERERDEALARIGVADKRIDLMKRRIWDLCNSGNGLCRMFEMDQNSSGYELYKSISLSTWSKIVEYCDSL